MKLNKRTIALLVCVGVLLIASVGATLAFLFDQSDSHKNTFTPANVACEVIEDGNDYSVKNTGNTTAYIRVAIVVNWKNKTTGDIFATAPTSNDYSIKMADGWSFADGYYYYTRPIQEKDVVKFAEIAQTENAQAPASDYTLSIEILASAIQAEPSNVVKEAWGIDPSSLVTPSNP